MPPVRRRNNLPLNRDAETTRVMIRNVQESAAQMVQDFVLALENFILNGISTFYAPTLQIKYYRSSYTRPQIFKDGSAVHDQRLSNFDNGYYILKIYRRQIKNHLQELFPQMTWRTELGGDIYIGITLANYAVIDDMFVLKEEAINNEGEREGVKDNKSNKDDKDKKDCNS